VFINLAKNAAEAMTEGGKISVKTRLLPESAKIMIDEKKKFPGNIEILISDTGPGIDEKLRETLFEPYTTTKTGAKNSGLGLSIVHSIVKALNGTIVCHSEKGRGTQFVVTLPVSSSGKGQQTGF
jgi:signal transduction histidine kinase